MRYGSLTVLGTITGTLAGNAASATIANTANTANSATSSTLSMSAMALSSARTIALSGDTTGSISFDGSQNVTLVTTLANTSVAPGGYGSAAAVPAITVDGKGRITSVASTPIAVPSSAITDATAASTGSTLVKRDASGNFSAGTITASLTGTASNATLAASATKLATARSIALTGDGTATGSFDGSANYSASLTLATVNTSVGSFGAATVVPVVAVNGKGLVTSVTPTTIAVPSSAITDATAASTPAMLVKRDSNGSFSANAITATNLSGALTGNASTATKLATVRTITLTGDILGTTSFDGSANVSITATSLRPIIVYADQFDNPVNSDWSVSTLAPATNDPTNSALLVRAFDDTAEEGVGLTLTVPAAATSVTLRMKGRASAAPSSSSNNGLVMRLHRRQIPMNAAVTAWSITTLTTIAVPLNALYQSYAQSFTLAALGLTAGALTQIELTRQGPAAADTLVGDWNMIEMSLEWA